MYRLEAAVAGFQAGMAQASASTKKLGADLTSMDKSAVRSRAALDHFGAIGGKVGLVAAAGLGAAAKAAIDWESAWAGVSKTVDGSAAEMATLEGELRDLAKILPASHAEIAAVAEAAGQLGVQRDSIASFTKTMIDLGETTNLSADEAATAIAQLANVMGTAPEDIERVGSALVALGNDGASTERQIILMAQRIAGAGAQIGLVESDLLAIANASASMGVEVEAGGTAISRVFTDMAKATAQGSEKLQVFAEVAGMSSAEFTEAFENDPARAFASFTEGLNGINQAGGDVFGTLDQLKLSDVRVSQSLLGMAASGDMLRESLDLGSKAWDENTALAIEAAKRYDTTAAQMQTSWNQIKDAGIDVGEAMLPVLSQAAELVGGLASAFGDLPGPVKSATGGLLGITAVLGGGLWFGSKVIGGVAATRDAMDALSMSAPKAAGALGKVGKAATIAGGALAALAVVDALQGGMDDYTVGVEAMTAALLNLAESEGAPKLTGELEGLGDSIDRLADPNKAQALQDSISGALGGIGGGSELKEARAQIDAIEASLTSLVETGQQELASDLLDSLGLTGAQVSNLVRLMPNYREALQGVANDAALAAGANDELSSAEKRVAAAANQQAKVAERQAAALQKSREAAAGTAVQFISLADAIKGGKQSLGDFLRNLEKQAQALRDFRVNAEKAGEKGLKQGLIEDLRALGPEGARQMAQLANATDSEIKRANQAWQSGQREIKRYKDEVGGVPRDVSTNLNVNAGQALGMIDLVRAQMRYLDGLTSTTYVQTVNRGRVGGGVQQYAEGGLAQGPGTATSDSIPALLSDGEFVTRAAAVDHYGVDFFRRLNAMQLADGGLVRSPVSAGVSVGSPNVNVGGPSVRVFIDGNEVRAIVDSRIDTHARHQRQMEGR